LKRAITGRQALQFTYVSSDGRFSERVVHPLKLIYKHKAWYLQAYCPIRQDYRLFKLNRMSQARRLAERFDGRMYAPPCIDAAVSSALILIKADFLPSAANRVFDEFSLNEITRNADGSLRLETLLPSDDWFFSPPDWITDKNHIIFADIFYLSARTSGLSNRRNCGGLL